MNLNYKKLNAIFIEMAKNMKLNGECNLGANSLLDRFAKGAKLKSRQELKHNLSKSCTSTPQELTCANENLGKFPQLVDFTATHFANEYQGLFRSNEKLIQLVKDHKEQALGIFISDEFYGDFFWDQFGLFASEFKVEPKHPELMAYAFDMLDGEIQTVGLNHRRYESLSHLVSELASKHLAEQLSHDSIEIAECVQQAFILNKFVWSEWIYNYAKAKVQESLTGKLSGKYVPEQHIEAFKEYALDHFEHFECYPLSFAVECDCGSSCSLCNSHGDIEYDHDACWTSYGLCGLLENGELPEPKKQELLEPNLQEDDQITYLCEPCCEQAGITFFGWADNEVGRKSCTHCNDNTPSKLHIV